MAEFTYTHLVHWGSQLPPWQADALRRLLKGQDITDADIAELATLAKARHLVGHEGATAILPTAEDVRSRVGDYPKVQLRAIHGIAHVNALAPGPVPFALEGLTVLYGGNATGKSGIARILKKACRASDPGGPVLPNVFEPPSSHPPSAIIEYNVGTTQRRHAWESDGDPEPELSSINIFDARCAAVQVERPNRISYTPHVLHLLRALAAVTEQVSQTLRDERSNLGERPTLLDQLDVNDNTPTSTLIKSLQSDTRPEHVDALCNLSPEDKARAKALERALAVDPLREATSEEARARRLVALDTVAETSSRLLSDSGYGDFRELLAKRNKTAEDAEAARRVFASSSQLDGAGTGPWKAMWEAARRYSVSHAYPGESFPVIRDRAVCVLCQEPLSTTAAARLRSFEHFVQDDVQQQANAAQADLDAHLSALDAIPLPRSLRRAVQDAGILDSAEGLALRRHLIAAKLRRRAAHRETAGERVEELPDFAEAPNLGPMRQAIREDIERYRAASQAEERRRMEQEYADLTDRLKVAPHRDVILAEISCLQSVRQINAALDDCKTQQITLKARQVAQMVITNRLRGAFLRNLSAFGFGEPPIEVVLGAGEYGEHPYELRLIARPEIPAPDVLSEGERTCVALAGFLAELETTGNSSAVVFDDPISSLDHNYRKRVAERLIREAGARQVVVFTHDVAFLFLLRKYAGELGCAVTELSLKRGYQKDHGRVIDGPPWFAMTVKKQIAALRHDLQEARRMLRDGNRDDYERRVEDVYRRLRQSWERAVEEVLLYGTVLRFNDSVQTQRLAKLTDISEEDVETVNKEMSRCSDFLHDEAGVVKAAIPAPDVVEGDIKRLDDWVKDLRGRGRS